MSANLLQAVWIGFPGSGTRLGTLLAIAELANEQGNCYVTVAQLAAAARLSRTTGQRAVNQLREERWIVTSRMLGQGARLVYQLNLPKLARSCREGVDAVANQAQCLRPTGPTEAALEARVRLRGPEVQPDAASQCDAHTQTGTAQAAALAEWPAGAAEDRGLSRQEVQDSEDDFRGAEVPDSLGGSLYGAAIAPDEAFCDEFAPMDEIDEQIAAMKRHAEKQGNAW